MVKMDKKVSYLREKVSAKLNYIKSDLNVADTSSQGVGWIINEPNIENSHPDIISASGKVIYVNATSFGRHDYVYLESAVSKGWGRGFGVDNLVQIISEQAKTEEKIRKLEEGFNNLVRNTWRYIFSKGELEDIKEISEDMLEESVRMNDLINEFKNNEE